MVDLEIGRDSGGTALYTIPVTDAGYSILLPTNDNGATTIASIAVPANATRVIFGYSSANDVWVSLSTFTIPAVAAQVFSASNVYQNPPPLNVAFGQTLYFRTPASCTLTLAFYS